MEDNKIRVGITQGDINGVGYEVILKTFADPVMLELCTPIIYGSPKVAAYHRKSLDLPANFSIVNSASEAAPNRLSVVNCTDDEVKVEFLNLTLKLVKLRRLSIDHVQLRTSEHRSMYSYVRLSIDRCTATYV